MALRPHHEAISDGWRRNSSRRPYRLLFPFHGSLIPKPSESHGNIPTQPLSRVDIFRLGGSADMERYRRDLTNFDLWTSPEYTNDSRNSKDVSVVHGIEFKSFSPLFRMRETFAQIAPRSENCEGNSKIAALKPTATKFACGPNLA